VGDRGLLRNPGAHRIAGGFDVLDVRPPPLTRRGAARARAEHLATGLDLLRGQGFVHVDDAIAMGWPDQGKRVGDWLVHEDDSQALAGRADIEARQWLAGRPLAAGMPTEILRQALGLPSVDLVTALTGHTGTIPRAMESLPDPVEFAVRTVEKKLTETPFRAPEADELRALGLGRRELAAAIRLGRLTAIADGVVLRPDAHEQALTILTGLDQPFTVSEARRALDTTRRVAVPLLEQLDALGHTQSLPDGRRTILP
jgi:selenocysteine-specific elongation factor